MTSGELHLHLNRYLSLRSALGYKMREVRRSLQTQLLQAFNVWIERNAQSK